jgi:hypothetical protein
MVGGVVVIYAMSAMRPRDDEWIVDWVGSRKKLRLALANAGNGVTYECCCLVEGIPMLIRRFNLMDSSPPPQTSPLGGLVAGKLLM